MKIVEYDAVDPVSVFQVTMLALDFALTPEHAAHIRRTDPRPFPYLAVCAVEDGVVVGHVGVFRLPMISIHGREDVGGIWAVSTHPQYARQGVASLLLEEAHARMRAAGLRFSTLDTDRYRVAHSLYQRHGYQDTLVWASALAPWETAHQPTRLQAKNAGSQAHDVIEALFDEIAQDRLGFAWRHMPFARLRDRIAPDSIWIFWDNGHPVGYAFTSTEKNVLAVSDLVLKQGVDAAEALAALTACLEAAFLRVTISRPVDIASLRAAGYRVAHPNWGAFMVKSLIPEIRAEEARHLFGIGTDQFLISWLDTT